MTNLSKGADNGPGKVVPKRLPPASAGARGGGPPWMGAAMPAEKALSFGPSARRLLRRMGPKRLPLLVVVALAAGSVTLSVIGPRLLGHATNLIFAGFIGKQIPSSVTLQQAVARAKAGGRGDYAEVLARSHAHPGQGIDFDSLGTVLLIAVCLYLGAAILSWIQAWLLNGVVQSTVRGLRADIDAKLNRLPLQYVDSQPRGELLSRVTNDIDNIGQSLQQTLSQVLTSLLTVIGVLTMMFLISPVLAVIALVTVPLSIYVTKTIAKRSQGRFIAQWRNTGKLNGQIEEAFAGHELVRVFGRGAEVEAVFAATNEELYQASFGAQFVSGIIMPAMMFIGNLNYVLIAVVGGLRVASGTLSLG
ncbi:ABC transporter ATP-binding protein, partial [Jatrophihabitans sp.]|uniref:ABC transporter permease n=1 Tax=Jatrophihabitans sp. TaxID=1932789 RepID=UPI0030C778C7|nr:lipid export ATP-binding/permease protein MsbA [Jatrophihabitans sp.]